jgi:hypothetical protein
MRIHPRCRASRSYRAEQSRAIGGDFSTATARSTAAFQQSEAPKKKKPAPDKPMRAIKFELRFC